MLRKSFTESVTENQWSCDCLPYAPAPTLRGKDLVAESYQETLGLNVVSLVYNTNPTFAAPLRKHLNLGKIAWLVRRNTVRFGCLILFCFSENNS